MSNSPTPSQSRIQEAIIRALRIPATNASSSLRMGATPGWDSMGHMAVVLELEKEFQVRFPPYALPELVDVPSIEQKLQALS